MSAVLVPEHFAQNTFPVMRALLVCLHMCQGDDRKSMCRGCIAVCCMGVLYFITHLEHLDPKFKQLVCLFSCWTQDTLELLYSNL